MVRAVLVGELGLRAWLQQLDHIRHSNQSTCEHRLVSGFSQVHHLSPDNNIDTSGHTSRGNITGELLDSELLPVHKSTFLVNKLERGNSRGHTVAARAFDRSGVLELLLYVLVNEAALDALERTKVQFGFDLGGPGDGALEGDKTAYLVWAQFSQFHVVSHVEESELEGVLSAGEVGVDLRDEVDHALQHHGVVALRSQLLGLTFGRR